MTELISGLSLSSLPKISFAKGPNKWADFIELSCLVGEDGECSGSDISSRLVTERGDRGERDVFEEFDHDDLLDGVEQEDLDEAQQDDRYEEKIDEWFGLIESRGRILGNRYPFTMIDEDTIRLKSDLTMNQILYLFLLVSSNTECIRKGRDQLTSGFELLSWNVMSWMYPGFICHVFGTSMPKEKRHFNGNVTQKIMQLASEINTEITRAFEQEGRTDSGDGELDLVAFIGLDPKGAEAPMMPLCLGQCACSYEGWKDKQGEIEISHWREVIEKIPAVHEIVFVPFPVRNAKGEWLDRNRAEIRTILVDRFRFMNIVSTCADDFTFFREKKAYEPFLTLISELPAVNIAQREAA